MMPLPNQAMPPLQMQQQLRPAPHQHPNVAIQMTHAQHFRLPPPATNAHIIPQQPAQPVQPTSLQQRQTNAPETTQSRDGWAQHAHEGRIFYYNSTTKVSTYDRPACLGPAPPDARAAQSSVNTASANQQKWKTYTDEKSGKKYYSDGVTTTWTRPSELGPEEDNSTNRKKQDSNVASVAKKRKRDQPQSNYTSKTEAIAAFKGLLLAKNISPNTKWNDVQKACCDDVRWEALTTVGERKQALAEYQTKRSNELREIKRLELQRGKEAFGRLLTDLLGDVNSNTARYENIRDTLAKDDRFHVVEDEGMREELFYDYVEESRKREERNRRMKKREAKDSFVGLLRAYEEQGKLTFASTWSSFLSGLNDDEKTNPKFVVSANMSDSDRQLFFADFVLHLQSAEDEKQRRILEARQRAEKAQRNAYRSALRQMAEEGIIRPDTRWRTVQEQLSRLSSYDPVYAQRRDAPRELFEDFLEEWNEEYRRDRVILNRAVGLAKSKLAETITIEDFRKHLLEMASPVPDLYAEVRRILSNEDKLSSCNLFYEERAVRADSKGDDIGGEESSEDEGEIIEQDAVSMQ